MRIALDVNLNSTMLQQTLELGNQLLEKMILMDAKLETLAAEVTETKTIMESAVTLINGIAQRISEAGVDKEQLDALVADLSNSSDNLAAAVAANTESETPPTE